MQVLCYLDPDDLALDRDLLRERVERLVRSGATVPGQPARSTRLTVTMPAALHEQLVRRATEARVSVGKAFGAYAAEARRIEAAADAPQPITAGQGMRPEQERALKEIVPGLAAGKVVVAELGTGVGKSRVLAAAAIGLLMDARAGRRPPVPGLVSTGSLSAKRGAAKAQAAAEDPGAGSVVAIAAPTVSNVAHLVREFLMLEAPDIRAAALLGRQQFVSRSRLAALLADNPSPPVQDWLDHGMPPRSDVGKTLCRLQGGVTALVDCLRAVDPDFPAAGAALGREEEGPDAEPFFAHRELAAVADLVFTTHAMACVDALSLMSTERHGVLPPLLGLFVDEAHRLEEAQASIVSAGLHLFTLRSTLGMPEAWAGSAKSVDAARKMTEALMEAVREVGDGEQLAGAGATVPGEVLARIRQLAGDLIGGLKKAASPPRKGAAAAAPPPVCAEALAALGQLMNPRSTAHVQFSPVRRFPSIVVGPSTVAPFLAARWSITPAVLLTSGTLLLPTLQGLSHSALAQTLALPADRIQVCQPVHPTWLTHSPVLYAPSRDDIALAPPKPGDADGLRAWAEAQGRVITAAAATAAGGMLVLCSGYERIKALAAVLEGLGDRLIVQDRKIATQSACEARFRAYRDRPVWLATGGAWTGLDLSDADLPAEDDFLLTDVVITATPFGMVHTSTHMTRVSRMGFVNEKRAALMMLRQGLGRLIRRQGLRQRRLWFLDGRLAQPQHAGLMSEVRGLLQTFAQRKDLPRPG